MAERRHAGLDVPDDGLRDEPIIAVLVEEDGREVVRYFTSEDEAERALTPEAIERGVAAAGAAADLDWDEAERELDRIRHESRPA